MTWVQGEILINRTLQEVFNFVADECNEPRYNPRMREAANHPRISEASVKRAMA